MTSRLGLSIRAGRLDLTGDDLAPLTAQRHVIANRGRDEDRDFPDQADHSVCNMPHVGLTHMTGFNKLLPKTVAHENSRWMPKK